MHAGTVGDIGCYSFNGNKIITTGGGGMIVTNNPDYAGRAGYLTTQAKDDDVRYVHNEVGYNYRMTNIQAAIGVAQLEQLAGFIADKVANYNIYKEAIDNIGGLSLAPVPPYANNNLWMYALQVERERYGKGRDELMRWLGENGAETRPLWYLNHLQRPYVDCQSYKIEKALEMWEKTLFIPCSVNLTSSEINSVIENLRNG
jgi:dTDP-4-amino-4,6-dideoxygalactose transaminase